MVQSKVHMCVFILFVLLSAVSVYKTSRGANMRLVCGCREGTTINIISNLKGYLIHTLLIKCPLLSSVLQWWIINYRSNSWAIYSVLLHEERSLLVLSYNPTQMLSVKSRTSSSENNPHYTRILSVRAIMSA